MKKPLVSKFLLIFFSIIFLAACGGSSAKEGAQKPFPKTNNPKIDALTEQIFKDPKNPSLYFQRAQLFYQFGAEGGYDFAIKDMEYALHYDSTNLSFYHFLTDIYLDYAQSRLAVSTMERAAALQPDSVKTLVKLGETYFIIKQYSAAVNLANRVLQRDPQNSEAYFLLGMVAKEQGESVRAINAFQKSADFDGQNRDAFIELGKLYTEKGNNLALKYLDNALLIDSLDVSALMAKAYFFQTKDKPAEAMAIYKKILTQTPRSSEVLFNIGLLYLNQDSLDKADQHFNIVVRESPAFFRAYFYSGQIAEEKGEKEKALKFYKQALAFKSDYQDAIDGVKRLEKVNK